MGFLGGELIDVLDWWQTIQSQPELGQPRIVRLTHVKNIDSYLAHEYVQLIILTKKGRERVVVERSKSDRFVFKGQWKMPIGTNGIRLPDPLNWAENDLPLPLYSLEWNEQNAPTFQQFTQICKAVHDKAPEYSFWRGKHCYWYALAVYQATKLAYGGVEKKWPCGDARGAPTFLLLWGTVESNQLKANASVFQENRATTMDWQVSGDAGPDLAKAALSTVESIKPALESEEFQKEYLEEMQAAEESKPTSIIDGLDIPTAPRREPSADAEKMEDPSSFRQEYDVLKEAMKNDPARSDNQQIFRDARDARANEGRDLSEGIMMVRDTDEYGYFRFLGVKNGLDMNSAMQSFIGGVLKEIDVTPKVDIPQEAP